MRSNGDAESLDDRQTRRRVLFMLSWDPRKPGGVTTAVLNLYDQIEQTAGWGSHLLVESWSDRNPATTEFEGRSVTYFRIPLLYVGGRALRALIAFIISFIPAAIRCRRFIRAHGIVMINIHFPSAEAAFWTLMSRLGLFDGSVILSFHGADVVQIAQRHSRYERALWRMIVRDCTALTACSMRLARDLRQLFPFGSEKIQVLLNGVDAAKISQEAQYPKRSVRHPDVPYLLCIAGYEHKKGLDILLHAFVDIRKLRDDLQLVLVCRDGPDAEGIHELIRELRLEGKVSIEVDCPHDAAMSLLSHAIALIVPSRREPFGLVVLEAGALGKPVVMTDVCGVLERLDRSLVTTVPANDAKALADGIRQILMDESAAEAKGVRLKGVVCSDLSWSHSAQQLLNIARRESPPGLGRRVL